MGIILTTGRSGSTAVSQVLQLAPHCLSLSEALMSLEAPQITDPRATLSGPSFAEILAEPTRMNLVLARHGLRTPEFWPGNRGRHRIPPLLVTTLGESGLPDPDAVQEACVDWARSQPPAPIGRHLEALFSWLTCAAGRSLWIERSGGSLFYGPEITSMFPEQPTVLLLRDPVRTVQSMHGHLGFRMAAIRWELRRQLAYDPYGRDASEHPPASGLATPYDRLLPESFDPRALATVDLPLEWFALYWARSVRRGLGVVEQGAGRVFWVEDLTARPDAGLAALAEALDIDDGDGRWRAQSAAWLGDAALDQAPPTGCDNPRIARLVRSALAAALELTEPDRRPRFEVVHG
jgi:hypothetical protein